jgi:hypothetical protein
MFCEDSSMFYVQWNKKIQYVIFDVFLRGPFCNYTPDVSRANKRTLVKKMMGQVNEFSS